MSFGNYAIFVASTDNYLPYVNALLNSIQKRELHRHCNLTVYLLYHDMPVEYPEAAKTAFSFRLIPVNVERADVPHPEGTKRIEFVKRARFWLVMKYAPKYDAVCLLDADMFIVSPEFAKLFDLVDGTQLCIACNERFKWNIGHDYVLDGKPILDPPQKLVQMHCSVPIIFVYKHWEDVFKSYTEICFGGRQWKNGEQKGIGDIYSWNISVVRCGKQDRIVVFPMSVMTQVHHTVIKPWTFLQVDHDYWYTYAGDRVYSVHGRVARPGYVRGYLERFDRDAGENEKPFRSKIEASLRRIQTEWYDLNFNGRLPLEAFVDTTLYAEMKGA